MTKLLLPLVLLTSINAAHATPSQADTMCLELEQVLQEFVDQGSNTLTQKDVNEILSGCYAAFAS